LILGQPGRSGLRIDPPGQAHHVGAIVAAGLSNFRLEGINAKIRLIQRRGFGCRNLDAFTGAITLASAESPRICPWKTA
jgi:hypothetical protein